VVSNYVCEVGSVVYPLTVFVVLSIPGVDVLDVMAAAM
jgi:hypothetical protein